jgi:methylenetetrahydrofolate dehydrogenase (NADP+)/methenyltetrahydrofolate cyclohydrolase
MLGDVVAQSVYTELAARIRALLRPPGLRVLRVGDDPASIAYVRLKDKKARALGIESQVLVLPEHTPEEDVLAVLNNLNSDPNVDGILVQLPLPPQINPIRVTLAIDPGKDVDGLHPLNIGRLWSGVGGGFVPCTPLGIIRMLDHYRVNLSGARVVVIGRSQLVGRPLAALLLNRDATVTLAHSKSQNLADLTREAQVLVVAAGRPGLVTPAMVGPESVVVDVGTTRVEGKLRGDVDPDTEAALRSPVPGGVGPLTVAMLLANTVLAAERRE